ncbi:MAG: Omp28-related outer membrane protein [Bacteroidetes bacterium]|nr:Omp28-related outer membrane protein [Bacteroidota bacterium]
MKTRLTILSILLIVAISGCKEIGPLGLDFNVPGENLFDTAYIATSADDPQDRIVLLEEFTGVKCVNCPTAHAKSEEIIGNSSGRAIGVAIHSGVFAVKYSGISQHDFKINEGEAIEAMINDNIGYPYGMVNRKGFPVDVTYGLTLWETLVDDELLIGTDVNMYLTSSVVNNNLTVRVELHYIKDITEDNYISVMILEDGIIDPQLGFGGVDTFYVHNNVLRDMLTPFNGFKIQHSQVAGRIIIQEFFLGNIPAEWSQANCRIIAFVNQFTNDFEVLQAIQKPFN